MFFFSKLTRSLSANRATKCVVRVDNTFIETLLVSRESFCCVDCTRSCRDLSLRVVPVTRFRRPRGSWYNSSNNPTQSYRTLTVTVSTYYCAETQTPRCFVARSVVWLKTSCAPNTIGEVYRTLTVWLGRRWYTRR